MDAKIPLPDFAAMTDTELWQWTSCSTDPPDWEPSEWDWDLYVGAGSRTSETRQGGRSIQG